MHNLQRYHLNGLRAAEAIGRLGTLQRAADELGVSPGAVSQHLIRLERQLGRDLFTRGARGLTPTSLGARLLPRLTAGFRSMDEALAAASLNNATVLTVSVAPTFASKWLVPRLARFRALHPGIAVRIDATTEIVDLEAGGIDVAIRVGRGNWPGVHLEKLLSQEVFPVCSRSLAARIGKPADLLELPVVLDANSSVSWDLWLGPHGLSEKEFPVADTFTDSALAFEAAVAGQGVMLAWQILAHDALAAGHLVAPFRDRAPTVNGYYLVTPGRGRDPERVTAFRRWLRGEVAQTMRLFETA